MIGYLEGEVIFTGGSRLILKVGGVGYNVECVGFHALSGQQLTLFVHDHIREDRRELYGFLDSALLALFEQLIDVSGVGTKLAQKMLASGSAEELSEKIIKGDIGFLTSIPGVGKKTAQKIVLELKGILVQEEEGEEYNSDVVEALMSLGYSRQDCIDVLKHVSAQETDDRIKEALQLLGRN